MNKDIIYRQDAIDILYNFAGCIVDTPNGDYCRAYKASRYKLETLPSVQPGRKKGKWKRRIKDSGFNANWYCSECGWETALEEHGYNFCPNCGADNRGEEG